MRQNVLCFIEVPPRAGNERDSLSGAWLSLKTQAPTVATARRYWTRPQLWRRHRPRSKQAGILRYPIEGRVCTFA